MSCLAPSNLLAYSQYKRLQKHVYLRGAQALAPLEAYDLRECRYTCKDPSDRHKRGELLLVLWCNCFAIYAGKAEYAPAPPSTA